MEDPAKLPRRKQKSSNDANKAIEVVSRKGARGAGSESERPPRSGKTRPPTNVTVAPAAERLSVPEGVSTSAEALRIHADDLSSDDELPKNTIGNVPLKWYADYDHIGYGVDGKRIAKPAGHDGMDRFLASQDDPHHKWTIYDDENGEEIVLSKRDVQLVQRIHSGTYAHPEFDPYADAIEAYGDQVEAHALNADDEPKRRFLPSKWEMMKVMRIAKAIKEGRFQRHEQKPKKPELYALWGDDDRAVDYDPRKKAPPPIAAPKLPLPGHAASYNPPPEFLFTDAEREAWEAMDPAKRPIDFIPRRYASLRQVPLYAPGVRERFERCLDLYLCPRLTRKKLDVDPEDLLPKLPDPAELRPFPTHVAVDYTGHTGRVRSVSVDPTGQWLASGGDDGSVRLWKITTGRCVRVWTMPREAAGAAADAGPAVVRCVAWCPDSAVQVLAVVAGSALHFIYPGTCTASNSQSTFDALTGARRSSALASNQSSNAADDGAAVTGKRKASSQGGKAAESSAANDDGESKGDESGAGCQWSIVGPPIASPAALPAALGRPQSDLGEWAGIKVTVRHPHDLRQVAWHRKGDYLVTVAPAAAADAVQVHQLSRHATQAPFAKSIGQPQAAAFHPRKPLLLVANQRSVRVYSLTKQALEQKLESGVKWISGVDVHPGGDHVLLSSYDHRTVWFDTELSSRPYKTLKYHSKAVRRAVFHPGGYPLMATASDDGTIHIFHARVFNDFAQNPVIVPVKILRGHSVTPGDELGCLDIAWHPTLPWLFSAGADRQVRLWHNLL